MIAVSFMVFAPGFAIGRLLRLDWSDQLDKIIFSMAIGFVFAWLLGFAAILIGLDINILALVWLFLLGIISVVTFVLDSKRTNNETKTSFLKIKDIFTSQNLIYLLVFVSAYLIIMYLVRIGALFKGGDVNYHLATLRKVIGGEPLAIHNLNYAREKMMIVYGFPVWHIFLGLVVKLTRSDIFIVWRDMAAVLLGFAMIVWYWLSRKILPGRNLAALAFIVFAFFGFYWGPAYIYSGFGIPHTFTQLLLLPLAVGLTLIYTFERTSWKLLIVIILLVLTGSAVHITFYFYLLTILIFLCLFYAGLGWFQPDYKAALKRLALLIGSQLIIIVPLALGLELKGHAVSTYFKIFQDPSYPTEVKYLSLKDFGEFSLYAYIGLPLVLLFVRRFPKLILLLSTLFVAPIVYFTFLREILSRLVGFVYVKRLYGSLDWNFLVWALVVGFILVLIDRLIARVVQIKSYLKLTIEIAIGVTVALMFYLQSTNGWAKTLWENIFDGPALRWAEQNYLWAIIVLGLASIAVFIWQTKKPKIQNFLQINEPKMPLINFFLASIFMLIVIAPDLVLFKTYLLEKNGPEYFWREMTPIAEIKAETYSASIGGPEVVRFINQNIPSKSVFDTNSGYFFLPVMVDQHMPTYFSGADTEHLKLYDEEATLLARLEILHRYKIDYLLVKPPKEGEIVFDAYPQYFIKLYEGERNIYQLNKPAINADYPAYCPPNQTQGFQDYIL